MNGCDLTPKHDQLKEKLVHGRCHHGTRSMGHKPDSVGGTLDGEGVCSAHRPSKGQGPGRTDSWTAAASKQSSWKTDERTDTSPKTTHRCRSAHAKTGKAIPCQGNAVRSTRWDPHLSETQRPRQTLGRIQSLDPSFPAGGNAKRYSCSGNSFTRSLKLTVQPPYKPATVLLGTEPGAVKSCGRKSLCRVFMVEALLRAARHWTQPRCPSGNQEINRATPTSRNTTWQEKGNELLIHTTTWMDPLRVVLSEKKPVSKFTRCTIPFP